MSSKLEPDVDESLNPDDVAGSEPPSWAVGPDEVMTLGLSGEYLYAVKTEPPSLCTPNSTESTRDAIDCSHNDFPAGTSEETSSLILQQLTILNHRLGEQLAEQRAFHCSMLGMMDRQIQVLEQLSNFTRNHQPKLETPDTDSSVSLNVHEAQTQTLEPYPMFLTPKSKPAAAPWKVSLLEVHKRSPSELGGDTEPPQTLQGCKENTSSPPSLEISPSTKNAIVQNGLCKHD
ncbi:uncharacterized protein LOC109084005 [Cyprinus carpio]|uniref:Uncharacterized protein LOC109084005 n=1 Tax=Cyprinus carpio TaxID=7962 RepID=A0A9R0ADY1_CYPCA|nr:uncharacterized protein LOC109084005 [Cyprinus carpio]